MSIELMLLLQELNLQTILSNLGRYAPSHQRLGLFSQARGLNGLKWDEAW